MVPVTTATRCVNVLAKRGQSLLHRGGYFCRISGSRALNANDIYSMHLEMLAGNLPFQGWCIPRVSRVVLIFTNLGVKQITLYLFFAFHGAFDL